MLASPSLFSVPLDFLASLRQPPPASASTPLALPNHPLTIRQHRCGQHRRHELLSKTEQFPAPRSADASFVFGGEFVPLSQNALDFQGAAYHRRRSPNIPRRNGQSCAVPNGGAQHASNNPSHRSKTHPPRAFVRCRNGVTVQKHGSTPMSARNQTRRNPVLGPRKGHSD